MLFRSHIHIVTHTQTHIYTSTVTHKHARTHTHTYTHTHAHTRTHTLSHKGGCRLSRRTHTYIITPISQERGGDQNIPLHHTLLGVCPHGGGGPRASSGGEGGGGSRLSDITEQDQSVPHCCSDRAESGLSLSGPVSGPGLPVCTLVTDDH